MNLGALVDSSFLGLPLAERQALARAAIDAGVTHFATADHVSFHTGFGFDGLIFASLITALDDRAKVVLGVYLLALRHPVLVARQLSSLAEVAPGRITLGVGIGGEDPHEFEVCGVNPKHRARRTDHMLTALIGLMTGEKISYNCEDFRFDEACIRPAPNPSIPIVIGGRSEAALKRAGRFADGWLGIWSRPEQFGAKAREVEAHARAAGRESVNWFHGYQPWVCIDENESRARERLAKRMQNIYQTPFERFEAYAPYGSAERVADALRAYAEQGCSYLNVMNVGDSPAQSLEGIMRLCEMLDDAG